MQEKLFSYKDPPKLCSPNDKYRLGFKNGSNEFTLWNADTNEVLWTAGSSGDAKKVFCVMQDDGNVVVRDEDTWTRIWSSQTADDKYGGANMTLDNDGHARIRFDDTVLWSTDSADAQDQDTDKTPAPVPDSTPAPAPDSTPAPVAVPDGTPAPVVPVQPDAQQGCGSELLSGGRLNSYKAPFYICSGKYGFGFNGGTDLQFWDTTDGDIIWSAGITTASTQVVLIIQSDANLVVRDELNWNPPLWSSGTADDIYQDAKLVFDNDHAQIVSDDIVVWSTEFAIRQAGLEGCHSVLFSGNALHSYTPPYYLCSHFGQYRFGFNNSTDLTLWQASNNQLLWSAPSSDGAKQVSLVINAPDGNLILRDEDKWKTIWSSGTGRAENSGADVSLENDGNVRVRLGKKRGKTIWTTDPDGPKHSLLAGDGDETAEQRGIN